MQQSRSFTAQVPRLLDGSVSPRALLDRCVEVIEQREQTVQAFVALDLDAARTAAEASSRRYAEGAPLSPVDGMVLAVKDIVDTAGLPTQMNSPIFAGHQPATDAACVRALRAGGAVILGKTHTTEFAFGRSAPTTNPHDPARTPGGSSSGSAAAVGAGMAPAALATQTQGSTLRPASYCGAAGYKPSHGVLSLQGVHPVSQTLDHLGVIAADVEDAWRVACQISRVHPAPGSTGLPGAWGEPPKPTLPGRLALLEVEAFSDLDDATAAEFERAIRLIEKAGVQVRRMGADAALAGLVVAFGAVPEASLDLVAWELRWPYEGYAAAHPGKLGPRFDDMLGRSRALAAGEYSRVLDLRRDLRRQIAAMRAEYDGFLLPASSGPAPTGLAFTGNRAFQTPWTFVGLPAWSVPGLQVCDLPFGMQIAGHLNDDLRLAGYAAGLETLLAARST